VIVFVHMSLHCQIAKRDKVLSKAVKKICSVVTTILVVLAVLLAVALVGVRVVGYTPYTILSGSMEPTYHVGALIYVKQVDPADLKVGDAITFALDENTIATHRIIEIVPDEEDPSVLRFATKGDANANADGSLVHYKNVIGTPVFTVPYLGYVADYIQHPPGMYTAIAAGVILLLLVFIPDMFDDDKKKKKDKPKE
jgi:signal peptidase